MIGVVKIVKVTIAVEAKVSKQVNLHIAKIANESRGVGMGHSQAVGRRIGRFTTISCPLKISKTHLF